jgi:hypothetical protein
MPNTIRIKRSTGSSAPTSLANAELAYAEGSNILYIGVGTGGAGGTATSIVAVGGTGAFLSATATRSANTVYAGPTTGGSAAATFRSLVAADLPTHSHAVGDITNLQSSLDAKANLASPALTGTPTAPTAAVDTNTTQLATTAYVVGQGYLKSATASSTYAPLASPALTGTPTAPTASVDTNSTQLATTAYVVGQAASATPSALGTAATGSSTRYARADHVHAMPTLSQVGTPTADLPLGGFKITNLADPTNLQDAATKNYVDSVAQGLDVKTSVVCATTANITLSGLQTLDGITVVAGDRVLVKNQSTASQNGIYVAASGAWTRATDADAWGELVSAFTFVERGTVHADSGWVSTVDPGGTLGTTAVAWTQFSGAGSYLAGNGLSLSGNTFSVLANGSSIDVSSSGVRVSATYAGQTSITTLGTVTTGTWNGSTVGVQWGGTGATTLTGYVRGNGTSAMTAAATIPNTDITGLGTLERMESQVDANAFLFRMAVLLRTTPAALRLRMADAQARRWAACLS